MLKSVLAAAVALVWFVAPAAAQQCVPVDAKTFIGQGVEAIESGEIKGVMLQGKEARAFDADAKEASGVDNEYEALAVAFVVRPDGSKAIVLVIRANGVELACVGSPPQSLEPVLKKHFGVGA